MYKEVFPTPSESHSFLSSFFSSEGVESPDARSRAERPKIITSEGSKVSEIHSDASLALEQQLSAQFSESPSVILNQQSLDYDTPQRSHAQSASCPVVSGEIASSSPAAMFLSSFSPATAPMALKPAEEGAVIAGYTLGAVIGYGGFSVIRCASSSSGGTVAVKIVRRTDLKKQGNAQQARRRLQHEASVWASLSHEHILPLFSVEHTAYADYFFTLYCPAGTLFDILKRDGRPALPQDDVGMMFRQVVRGLRYLHEVACIVHRDMKLENVLVDEMGVCKISDFGMTQPIGTYDEDSDSSGQEEQSHESNVGMHRASSISVAASSRRQTNDPYLPSHPALIRQHASRHRSSTSTTHVSTYACQPGSLPYASPELLQPPLVPGPRMADPSQDIWALGVMLHTLLTGKYPFSDSFEPRLQFKILHCPYEVPHGIGHAAERVLNGCLDRVCSTRWTISMVDEVAWGVGWGLESDEVAHSQPSAEELESHRRMKSPTRLSRSTSRHAQDSMPEEPLSASSNDLYSVRSAREAASRRSKSRSERSLSRAPVLTDRSSSARSIEGNLSRHRRQSSASTFPSEMSNSVMSVGTSSSASSAALQELEPSSASPLSPLQFLDRENSLLNRGRRRRKASTDLQFSSRSPSVSVMPTTPEDISTPFFSPSLPLALPLETLPGSPPSMPHPAISPIKGGIVPGAPLPFSSETDRLVAEDDLSADSTPELGAITHSQKPGRADSSPPAPLLSRHEASNQAKFVDSRRPYLLSRDDSLTLSSVAHSLNPLSVSRSRSMEAARGIV